MGHLMISRRALAHGYGRNDNLGLARIIRNPMRKRGIARNYLAYASGYESSLLCLQIDLT